MNERDTDIHELLSRGIDADLDRGEMRALYRAVARDDALRAEAGTLAELEAGLIALGAAAEQTVPRAAAVANLRRALRQRSDAPKPAAFSRFWSWLHHPQGISVQPLSFASGLAIATLAYLFLGPVLPSSTPVEPARFTVHDVPFETARARVDWTYQFIVLPGGATRVLLEMDDDLPMRLRFEAAQPVAIAVDHRTAGKARSQPHNFTVEKIGFASLRAPRAGDVVTVHNNGSVPVVVYAYTNGYGGSWVVPGEGESL